MGPWAPVPSISKSPSTEAALKSSHMLKGESTLLQGGLKALYNLTTGCISCSTSQCSCTVFTQPTNAVFLAFRHTSGAVTSYGQNADPYTYFSLNTIISMKPPSPLQLSVISRFYSAACLHNLMVQALKFNLYLLSKALCWFLEWMAI